MTSAIVSRVPTHDADVACVGSFRTAYAAELAIDHLAEHGFERQRLHVRPADLAPTHGWQARTRRRPRNARSLAIGLTPAAVLITVAILSPLSVAGWLYAGSLTASAISAAVGVCLERRWAARTRQRARADRTVVAGRFDVICTDAADRARHVLARWWDPAAPPAPAAASTVEADRLAWSPDRLRHAA
jgi:hypothetical protein